MPHDCKIAFILLLLALAAYGQQERVAILNTVDNNDSLGFNDMIYLTDRLRETAVKILPKQRYGVMTTESIVAFFGSQERAAKVCNESSCLAEVGRQVSADYVAQARVGRFGNQLSINFQLYNVKTGNLIDSFTGNSKDIFGLLAVIDENAPTLFKKMLDESSRSNDSPIVVEAEKNFQIPEAVEPYYVPRPAVENPTKTSFWVALGLDVLGVAVIIGGVLKNQEINEAYDRYSERGQSPEYYKDARKEMENKQSSRNTFYIVGGALLASGIAVHIWF